MSWLYMVNHPEKKLLSEDIEESLQSSPLIDHLLELRSRLAKCLLVVVLIFTGLIYFANQLYEFVAQPILSNLPQGSTMIATGVVTPFLAPFKLTFVIAVFVAMPVIIYQMWAFISPGLYQKEKKLGIFALVITTVLFYAGVVFAYYLVFPVVMGFLMTIGPQNIKVMPDIAEYLAVALKLFLAFGFAFEMPIITYMLIRLKILSYSAVSSKRAYVVVACFVMGMLMTPPDVISQVLLALPMWLLFELGLLMAKLTLWQKTQEEQ